ncbi:MAG: UDP-N-acetylmuramate:L-alanyl-gamma-D-glutamyl-meso-diaminopimelate ligase [Desulfobacter postgatei]|uniref:UDP-N-acetylmuramate:L-alanyl-gamma-D-glutamyl-meso-diaminopimelate ligase n=1 Tax=Desulfobacter postgatei TaxID=2293 RepID=A0A2G6MQF3_9BACT|nr:MAG: UDP-N-acetylmuramate:L-alanyl-gamma-D-glutamyl-meso-diaminopimelate ligase [Desulfobacter postgatei]
MADSVQRIHLVAACGTGMGTLACILKQMGYMVTGSDQNVYPPMSDFLKENGITLFSGFDPSHISEAPDQVPDLVIIGNAVTRDNPEAVAVMERGLDYMSMPQAVNRFIASDKKIILVTGTHGKTTTCAIMAHLLETAGLSPSFMIGGILKDYNSSFKIGDGEYMVIEGDEYDTAFFDKGPKFMHYDPCITIITGIEFDHADIFDDLDHICRVFDALVSKVKDHSRILACRENVNLMQVLEQADGADLQTYGTNATWQVHDHRLGSEPDSGAGRLRTLARITGPGTDINIQTDLPGRHNLLNATACIAAARSLGIKEVDIARGLSTFSGIKRRQEIRGQVAGVTVMDDFAHHPTAVKQTIAAVKPFYPQGRLVAVFEPRTNTSMRNIFQAVYPACFDQADLVCICSPGVKKNIPEKERFSPERLTRDICKRGRAAHHFHDPDQVIDFLALALRPKDLVLIMSNGGFGNIHQRLLERLGAQ